MGFTGHANSIGNSLPPRLWGVADGGETRVESAAQRLFSTPALPVRRGRQERSYRRFYLFPAASRTVSSGAVCVLGLYVCMGAREGDLGPIRTRPGLFPGLGARSRRVAHRRCIGSALRHASVIREAPCALAAVWTAEVLPWPTALAALCRRCYFQLW